MQKDFHYYIIGALTTIVGFSEDEVSVVSYASQYVDDNTGRYYLTSDDAGEFLVDFPAKVLLNKKPFKSIITQTDDVFSWASKAVQRDVYAPFHFIPGDNDRIGNQTNKLSTTRKSLNAGKLLGDALSTGDLYRIGIALHTYADTWSHEHFSAFLEDWNKAAENLLPSIGHAKVKYVPDQISLSWKDSRFADSIDNKGRAMEAISNIFSALKTYRNSGVAWGDVRGQFEDVVDAPDHNSRIDRIKGLYPSLAGYDENAWINGAFKFERDPAEIWDYGNAVSGVGKPKLVHTEPRDDFAESHWFRFQKAAKAHLLTASAMVAQAMA